MGKFLVMSEDSIPEFSALLMTLYNRVMHRKILKSFLRENRNKRACILYFVLSDLFDLFVRLHLFTVQSTQI